MSEPTPEMAKKIAHANDTLLAEGQLMVGEVGAGITVTAMVYSAMQIAAENKLCPHCVTRTLLDILAQLNDVISHDLDRRANDR